MIAMRASRMTRVVCPGCKWKGNRVYVPSDVLGHGRADDRQGFGQCPTCKGQLVQRPKHQEREQKRAAKAKAQLHDMGVE